MINFFANKVKLVKFECQWALRGVQENKRTIIESTSTLLCRTVLTLSTVTYIMYDTTRSVYKVICRS